MVIFRFFSFGQYTPGDRLQTYERLWGEVEPLPDDDLLALVSQGIRLERHAIERENLWEAPTRRAAFGPEVMAIDVEVDHDTGVVYRVLKAHAMGNAERDPLAAKAQRVLAAVFPAGLAAVTSQPYVRQVGTMEGLVSRLQTEFAGEMADLSLTSKVAHLAERVMAYRRAITVYTEEITFAEVREARERGRRFFPRVFAQIVASYYDEEDPAKMAICEKLLVPFAEQDEQYRTRRKERRRAKARQNSREGAEDAGTGETGDGDGSPSDDTGSSQTS